jgi:hypothetical protein
MTVILWNGRKKRLIGVIPILVRRFGVMNKIFIDKRRGLINEEDDQH